jgi:DNA-binding transcriptional MerR regulator
MSAAADDNLMTIGEAVAMLRESWPEVSHSSLRFLQREGLIDPQRTPGGHRLYAASDLDRIRLIKQWQDQRLSLVQIRQRLADLDALETPASLAARVLDLAIAGDGAGATRLVLLTDDRGMPLVRMFDEVLRPVLVEIGSRWAAGNITVAQEHECSELVRDLIAQLTVRHAAPHPGRPVVVAACVADELHELGLRMVAGALRERQASVHYLGANVSTGFLVDSVRRRQPDIVLLSAALGAQLPALRETVAALLQADLGERDPVVIVGGQAVAGHTGEFASDFVRILTGLPLESMVDQIIAAWVPA